MKLRRFVDVGVLGAALWIGVPQVLAVTEAPLITDTRITIADLRIGEEPVLQVHFCNISGAPLPVSYSRVVQNETTNERVIQRALSVVVPAGCLNYTAIVEDMPALLPGRWTVRWSFAYDGRWRKFDTVNQSNVFTVSP